MTVCRARCFPVPNTVLYTQTWPALNNLISRQSSRLYALQTILASYMLSGFLLSALLSAPYSAQDVSQIKDSLMWKEVSVMESIPRNASIDWTAINTFSTPLHPDLRPSPKTNAAIRSALTRWLHKCQHSVLYPSMGNKSVSFDTRTKLEQVLQTDIEDNIDVTSTTVEHFYSRTGILLQGACEMKQKWYPTQASPRTYYAQGGLAYHSSKFLRDPINWLCDAFNPTNRYSRVSPSGIPVNMEVDDVYIYDLTSFTSLFHEHRSFLIYLASLTMEEMVTIFDSWQGPQTVSLGQMIIEYLEQNVSQPSYMTRIQKLQSLELHHSIAGFLGVYGNLMSCTFPHGICVSTVNDSPQDCWCAGDDAGTKESKESDGQDTFNMCTLLGSVARDKTFRISEAGAIALKRPISVHMNVTYHHPNVIWPVFAIMADNDPRFYDPMHRTPLERIAGSLVAFFKSCTHIPLSPSDIAFALNYFESFYQRYRLPESGWYPPLTGTYPWSYTIPRLDKSVFGKDPLHVLIDSFYGTEYVTGLLEEMPWDQNLPVVGTSFVCNSEQHLSYLVKLGYLSRNLVTCIIPGSEGLSRAKLDVDRPHSHRLVYEFLVIESIPDSLQPMSQIDE